MWGFIRSGNWFLLVNCYLWRSTPLRTQQTCWQSLLPQKSSSIAWTWLMSLVARWEIPQPIVPGGVISNVSCLLRGEWIFAKVEIVVVCGSYLIEKTYGEKWAKCGSEVEWNGSIATEFVIQACISFVVRWTIGWGV